MNQVKKGCTVVAGVVITNADKLTCTQAFISCFQQLDRSICLPYNRSTNTFLTIVQQSWLNIDQLQFSRRPKRPIYYECFYHEHRKGAWTLNTLEENTRAKKKVTWQKWHEKGAQGTQLQNSAPCATKWSIPINYQEWVPCDRDTRYTKKPCQCLFFKNGMLSIVRNVSIECKCSKSLKSLDGVLYWKLNFKLFFIKIMIMLQLLFSETGKKQELWE